jgi:hypothetical protein
MTQPRSSFVMALQEYRGPRPGVALTVAAVCLVAALVTGILLILILARFGTAITDGQQTLRAMQRYTVALQEWWELATLPEAEAHGVEVVERRDSIGTALRIELREFQVGLSDSVDRALIATILEDVRRPGSTPDAARSPEMGARGRQAMAALAARRDSALVEGVRELQRAQLATAVLLGLTVLAAVALVAPLSWMYIRYKHRVPAGL